MSALIGAEPAQAHRLIAGRFGEVVAHVRPDAWDAPSPVAEWRARDVVEHLVTWLPGFLESGAGVVLPPAPSASLDPAAAWTAHSSAVQALLDDPATPDRVLRDPHIGEIPLPQAIDRFYTTDVFLHTWDLARATGQEPRLDPEKCRVIYEGMLPIEEMLRASGQFGQAMPAPEDADIETRLFAFLGRPV